MKADQNKVTRLSRVLQHPSQRALVRGIMSDKTTADVVFLSSAIMLGIVGPKQPASGDRDGDGRIKKRV